MLKRIAIAAVVIIVALLTLEIIGLLQLKSHLKSYAAYWKHTPTSGTFTYVALGDSAAQGIGASKPEYGYVGLLADRIARETGQKVRIVNLSVSGAKIQDVIDKQIPELKAYKPALVTLDIGSNDVAGTYNSMSFRTNYDKLGAALPKGTFVGNIPYFGGRIRHNAQALNANRHIAETAQKYNLHLVDLQTMTRERKSLHAYAPDLFHPSNYGYQNWADAYWKGIKPTL